MSQTTAVDGTRSADDSIRSADAVCGLLTTLLRHMPRDLSLTSLSALSTLRRTGPRRVSDLALAEGITQPSVTTLVTALERAGFVERRSAPDDKRVVLVALTTAGADYLRTRRRTRAETFAQLIDKLPAQEAAVLAAAVPALERLRELDEEQRDPSPGSPG
jgi:DNA-binding MarR family transcriptional regulator